MNTTYEIIKKIIKEKKENKKVPECALFVEIIRNSEKSTNECKKEINELIENDYIIYRRTINDYSFYLK